MNHPPIITRVITATSAAALVAASAGFGAFYAWTTGSHHGPILGGLSVLMAVGLEGAKPFAVEGVFAALRSWSPIRAAALVLLGAVAGTYSLTAELSLMAATRADTAAQRTQARDVVAAARARYATAQHELEALPMTRPVAAINAEIARLKTTRGLVPCDDMAAYGYGPTTRRVCAQMAALSAEGAMSARRDELQTTLRNAERDLASAPPATDADPAASVLVAFLAAAGVPSDTGTLSKLLALVPVLALEAGSALAVVLTVGTRAGHVPVAKIVAAERDNGNAAAPSLHSPATGIKAALLEHLKAHGGSIRGGQRGLAKALGVSTTELHRSIHALAACGIVRLKTAPAGTELHLLW